MTAPVHEIRVQILDAIAARVNTAYGPAGAVDTVYRHIATGPWRPGAHPAPSLNIADAGQNTDDTERENSGENAIQFTSRRTLVIQLTLELPAQWDRAASYRQWIDHIENLTGLICAADLNVAGIEHVRYAADDLWTATTTQGESTQIWTLDYEIDYWITYQTPTT